MVLYQNLIDHQSYYSSELGGYKCVNELNGNPLKCCRDIFSKPQMWNKWADHQSI